MTGVKMKGKLMMTQMVPICKRSRMTSRSHRSTLAYQVPRLSLPILVAQPKISSFVTKVSDKRCGDPIGNLTNTEDDAGIDVFKVENLQQDCVHS